ncbi:NtaA/DmoA family FMN-dependent monooxygenase [Actinoplanes sp. CA-131856]
MTNDTTSAPHRRQMLIGAQLANYGSFRSAWRWPAANPRDYLGLDAMLDAARWAERGALQVLFLADHPAMREDLTNSVPSASIDPIVVVTHLIANTSRIGVALTQSTTFNFPYTVARQLKALDVLSGGRIGWNAVTANDPTIAANYGTGIADREQRYARAHEFIQLVQALWGSFGENALLMDVEAGVFADGSQIQPINLGGQYVASRGPLPIPASAQGQPILFQAGGGTEALQLAGHYASGVYSMATDVRTGRAHRANLDEAARAAGREPTEINMFMGLFTTIADTEQQALDRRHQLMDLMADTVPGKLQHLAAIAGTRITLDQAHTPLPERQRASLRSAPGQMHSERAVRLLQEGKTPYETLLYGVLDFHTTLLGSPEQIADQMEELFTQGAADGFLIVPDVQADGLPDFVEKVVPILQDRGLFHKDYEGTTLRDHFGVARQYGRRNA